jgi:hypothetical protein
LRTRVVPAPRIGTTSGWRWRAPNNKQFTLNQINQIPLKENTAKKIEVLKIIKQVRSVACEPLDGHIIDGIVGGELFGCTSDLDVAVRGEREKNDMREELRFRLMKAAYLACSSKIPVVLFKRRRRPPVVVVEGEQRRGACGRGGGGGVETDSCYKRKGGG